MTGLKRILPLAAVALAVACNDNELLPTDPTAGPVASASLASASSTGMATIITVKDDYVPHEKVEMVGSGWQPDETVTLTLSEEPRVHPDRSFEVTADSVGSFLYNEFAPEDHHAGVRFVLTALGQSSGFEAQTSFTDAITLGPVTSNTNGNGTNGELTFSIPQVNAGDVVIAQVAVVKMLPTQLICPPSVQWLSIRRTNNKIDNNESDIIQETFYHIAPSTTSGAVSHTWRFRTNCSTGPNISEKRAAGGAIRYSGVHTSAPLGPIDVHAGNAGTSSGPFLAPDVTTSGAGARVLRFFGVFKNTNITVHSSDVTNSTRRYIAQSSGGAERSAAAFDVTQTNSGATGQFRANVASGAEWVSQTVALRMAVVCTAPAITVQPENVSKTIGESATFSVTATGTNLTYQWFKNEVAIADATGASYTIPSVALADAGSYHVVVTGGCGSPVASSAATLTVTQRQSQTSVASSLNPSTFGQSVTFTATVTPQSGTGTPTGEVRFLVDGQCSDAGGTTAALSGGQASFQTNALGAGPHTITGCYQGDAVFAASEGQVSQTVQRATPTFSALSSPTITFGDGPTAISGTVKAGSLVPPGEVSITLNGVTQQAAIQADGSFSSSFATGALGVAGSPYSIAFNYPASDNFHDASGSSSLTVEKATPAFSTLSSPTITYGDTPTNVGGKISKGSLFPTGNVSITLNGVTQASAIGANGLFSSSFVTNALGVASSPYAITYSYAGDANFHPVSPDGTGSLTVQRAPLTVTADDKQKDYDGQPFTAFTVAYAGFVNSEGPSVLGGTLQFGGTAVGAVDAGSYTIVPSGLTSDNYAIAYEAGTLTIDQVPLTVTAVNRAKVFDGQPYPFNSSPTSTTDVTYAGFVNGEGPSVLTGTITFNLSPPGGVNVGTYTVTPSGLGATNYDIGYVAGTLTIQAWTLTGYYQPVDMSAGGLVYNTVKGGSTVPLKFNIYQATTAGTNERTDVAAILSFDARKLASCSANAIEDAIEELATTGGTELRYSGTHFIQNWKTPKMPNTCYKVVMTALDGSKLEALFKLK